MSGTMETLVSCRGGDLLLGRRPFGPGEIAGPERAFLRTCFLGRGFSFRVGDAALLARELRPPSLNDLPTFAELNLIGTGKGGGFTVSTEAVGLCVPRCTAAPVEIKTARLKLGGCFDEPTRFNGFAYVFLGEVFLVCGKAFLRSGGSPSSDRRNLSSATDSPAASAALLSPMSSRTGSCCTSFPDLSTYRAVD